MLELIINKKNDTEIICLIENGKLIEFYEEDELDKKSRLEGNIYMGKVVDILPGMQAAFVDFGGDKKGLMHLKDAIPQVDERIEKLDPNLEIKDVLKTNDNLLVQVKKDSNEKKGARVSTHISLPGKYIVFMPKTSIITISQKIQDENKRKKLLKLMQENLPHGNGAIVRTSAQNATDEEILKDLKEITKKWQEVLEKSKTEVAPKLILKSQSIEEKIIMDLGCKGLEKVTVNSIEQYDKIKKCIQSQNNKIGLELVKNENILNKYDIEKQIEKLANRKIWLNCGGFITIDKTEALTAIDVNTGKFTGHKDLEKTIFKVNKEATIEIARELRLRDIGGIIIIDYIDMKSKENKDIIENLLKESLKSDRAKTQVEGFTKLNLMEMTRKHICSHKEDKIN